MQTKASRPAAIGSRQISLVAGVLVAAASLAWPGRMAAQTPGAGGETLARAIPKFGTTNLTFVRLTGLEFFPILGSDYGSVGGFSRYPTTGNNMLAGLHLPDGSIIDYLEIDFCDTLDPEDIHLFIEECDPALSNCVFVPNANVNSFGASGCSAISTSGIGHQVDNLGHFLVLVAEFQAEDNPFLTITGAAVGYRLQVSPPPAQATFNDVPTTHPFFRFIEALAASGITAGCGGGNFCPDQPLTRGQMAVFLAKALGLSFN
jgi:S-layer homology domain